MALGRRNAARRSQARQLDHGADLSAAEGALREGGRRRSGADRQSRLALPGSGRADGGRTGQGDERLRDRRHHRPERSKQSDARQRQASRELCRAARRRQDGLRLLDLFRLLQRGGKQYGPPRQHRSRRHRRVPQMGMVLAAQSAGALQSRFGRHGRQTVGSEPQAACGGTAASGRATTFPTLRRRPSRTWSGRSS